jgi:hypothetical protein
MTGAIPVRASVGQRLLVAARFIVFGIGGLWLLMISCLGMIDVNVRGERWASPFLLAPLGLVGAFAILFGVREWRRWAYLWVFVSIPIGILVTALADSKEMGVVAFATPIVVSYALVKLYYRRRDGRQAQQLASHGPDLPQNAGPQ